MPLESAAVPTNVESWHHQTVPRTPDLLNVHASWKHAAKASRQRGYAESCAAYMHIFEFLNMRGTSSLMQKAIASCFARYAKKLLQRLSC